MYNPLFSAQQPLSQQSLLRLPEANPHFWIQIGQTRSGTTVEPCASNPDTFLTPRSTRVVFETLMKSFPCACRSTSRHSPAGHEGAIFINRGQFMVQVMAMQDLHVQWSKFPRNIRSCTRIQHEEHVINTKPNGENTEN